MRLLIIFMCMFVVTSAHADCLTDIDNLSIQNEASVKKALKCLNEKIPTGRATIRPEKRKVALVNYLKETKSKVRKFSTVKRRLGDWYTPKNLIFLIEDNPDVLRKANMKGGGVGLTK